MTQSPLKKEFEYYLSRRAELLKEYEGKFIVIKDQKVIGVYDTQIDAYTQTQKEHELGTFLIQEVSKDESTYSQTFYSRAIV
ncbi:hypothetical protein A2853_02150 [Candidatus Kaiserbacteria bacterium RIFCSPHIGHO2_01_FULL_55_17]|uniref:DUF5678 domain-containing protein n=1 Tax=Candidatus Kaiserbacteria bacterium RIFCSPHIGHO2_01_FULL_55_17 TaxID=1798484 RepID=A0A1F6D789_9BACT|nr:MAG: hypothetical protein A2853_02150 [Candidatus Kaiserbacteria bacterium RIFCSPHIGHO2_01_FULL_55_17]